MSHILIPLLQLWGKVVFAVLERSYSRYYGSSARFQFGGGPPQTLSEGRFRGTRKDVFAVLR